jgi:polyhydroxyalkanoate synthesis regulator phasin
MPGSKLCAMSEPSGPGDTSEPTPTASSPSDAEGERAGDALRSAVERTLAATAGSAAETRQRARELLDEVSRRGEAAREGLTRRGEAAREEVTRRGEAARGEVQRVSEEAGTRLSEAIAELRSSSREDLGRISERIGALEDRLAAIERALETRPKAQPEVENRPPEGDSRGG